MASTIRLKACGGLAPYTWVSTGPATLSAAAGGAVDLTCNTGTSDSTAVTVTVVDAAGVSVTSIMSGSCVCGCACDEANMSTVCTTDYMRYCYVHANATWGSSRLTMYYSLGCGNGGSNNLRATASGSLAVSDTTHGGLVLAYGDLNPNVIGASGHTATAHAIDFQNWSGSTVFSGVVGTPAFGVAVNCALGATCTNFTGLVVLLDNRITGATAGQIVLGQYTAANLDAGASPTVISVLGSASDWNDIYEINLLNGFHSGGVAVIQAFLIGNVVYITYDNPPEKALVSPVAGYGMFWLGGGSSASQFNFNYDNNSNVTLSFV